MQIDATEQPTPRSAEWLAGWDAGRAQVGRLASVVTRQRSEIDTLGERAEKAEAANQALESLLTFSPHTTTLQAVAELVGEAWRENKQVREERDAARFWAAGWRRAAQKYRMWWAASQETLGDLMHEHADTVDLLADVWQQFAVPGKDGKLWAGGLSTLEAVDRALHAEGSR